MSISRDSFMIESKLVVQDLSNHHALVVIYITNQYGPDWLLCDSLGVPTIQPSYRHHWMIDVWRKIVRKPQV